MSDLNKLAIHITKKIEQGIILDVYSGKLSPTFYNLRETILNTLTEHIKIFVADIKSSPMEISQMPEHIKKDYLEHKKIKTAQMLCDEILKSNYYTKTNYNDEHGYYMSDRLYISIVKPIKEKGHTEND